MNTNSTGAEIAACHKYYKELQTNTGKVLDTSLSGEFGLLHSRSHASLSDFKCWTDVLKDRPEVQLLRAGVREYHFALLALAQGFYRHAFMALRLFLELSVHAVNLSANELQLRLWICRARDLSWSEIIDEEKGVFSVVFIRAFCPELKDEALHYRALAKELYRECSEYVHGNPDLQTSLPETLEFSENVFRAWHSMAGSACLVVHFVLAMRYLSSLTLEDRSKLESTLVEELGHLHGVRCFFGNQKGC